MQICLLPMNFFIESSNVIFEYNKYNNNKKYNMEQYATKCGSIHPSIDSSGKWNTKNRIQYLIALKRRINRFKPRDQKIQEKEIKVINSLYEQESSWLTLNESCMNVEALNIPQKKSMKRSTFKRFLLFPTNKYNQFQLPRLYVINTLLFETRHILSIQWTTRQENVTETEAKTDRSSGLIFLKSMWFISIYTFSL